MMELALGLLSSEDTLIAVWPRSRRTSPLTLLPLWRLLTVRALRYGRQTGGKQKERRHEQQRATRIPRPHRRGRRTRRLLVGSSSEADLTTAPAEAAPSPQLDVAYADTAAEQRLDLYQPAAADKPAPLVIYIHGGAWRTGDKGIVTVAIHRQPHRSLRAAPTWSRFRCLT